VKRFCTTPGAYRLLHEGTLALAEVEHNGIRIDKAYLDAALDGTAAQMSTLEHELRADPLYARWRRRFGDRTKLTSADQLADVIFGELGYKSRGKTKSEKREKADEAAFEGIDLPFIKTYFKLKHLIKARGTFLEGFRREMVEHSDGAWFIHPNYNLNTVATFRSSCDSPNWQQMPVRNKIMEEIVRRCIVARAGHLLVELDYSQAEIRVAGDYTLDPVLIEDVTKGDVHRALAARLFRADPADVSSAARHVAKNKFVFPQFYGDYYVACAKSIWDALEFQGIRHGKDNKGLPMKEWLASRGIRERGACDPALRPVPRTFEHLVKEAEDYFWNERWRVFTQWKRDWHAAYLRDGGFMMKTGFGVNQVLARNEVINYPIQGPAFHCLLWSLIRMNQRLRQCRMRSRMIGQTHDSMLGDVHPRERDDFIHMAREVMTRDLHRAWDWLTVPMEVEAEICPLDGSWFEKSKAIEQNGTWVIKP
jgi:DNA polymerase I